MNKDQLSLLQKTGLTIVALGLLQPRWLGWVFRARPARRLFMLGYGAACFTMGTLWHQQGRLREKFGLDPWQRRVVWFQYEQAQAKASHDAEKTYPVQDPRQPGYSENLARQQTERRLALWEELLQKYTREVLEKYGLTDRQFQEIEQEGVEQRWHQQRDGIVAYLEQQEQEISAVGA